jgi:hypothetical protein
MNPISPSQNKPFSFVKLKKGFKKRKDLLTLGHPTHAGPPSPTPTSQTGELLSSAHTHLGSQCTVQLPAVRKSAFSKSGPKTGGVKYLGNETYTGNS